MSSGPVAGPTQTASDELQTSRWESHQWFARIVRFLIFIFPLVVSIIASLWVSKNFPPERVGLNKWVWWIGLAIAAMLLVRVLERAMSKLTPLTVLFRLSLIFPDQAPSRFSVALKTGSTRSVKRRLADIQESGELFSDEDTYSEQMLELVAVLAEHDRMTRGHAERVRAYSELIGEEMGLGDDELGKLRWSALLHDMGKLHVPSEILNKEGRPTDEEWAILKEHPAKAEEYLAPLADWLGEWRHAAVGHHERWDGNGYPLGQAGTDIPLSARIVAVADAFDVMTSTRSYKKPMPAELARQEVADKAGSQFDPVVSRAFMNIGLGDLRRTAGPLAFFTNLPIIRGVPLGNALTTAVSSAASAATAAVAIAVNAIVGLPEAQPPAPEQLAFAEAEPPVIAAPDVSGDEDQPIPGSVTVSGTGPFSITVTIEPSRGDVALGDGALSTIVPSGAGGDLEFVYTPDSNSNGTDAFAVQVCDATNLCSSQNIVVSIAPIDDVPSLSAPSVSVDEGGTASAQIDTRDLDGDELTLTIVEAPTNGTASIQGQELTITHDGSETAEVALTIAVSDGITTVTQNVVVDVNPINDAPVAEPDSATTLFDEAVQIPVTNLLANDTDVDSDSLSVSTVGSSPNGTVTLADGIVTFTPTPGFSGETVFSYLASDGELESPPAQVTITVGAKPSEPVANVNQPPVFATPETLTIAENAGLNVPVTNGAISATDPEGDAITYSIVDLSNTFAIDPATGEISLVAPPLDFENSNLFAVTIIATDAASGSQTTLPVVINVVNVNEAPAIAPLAVPGVPENAIPGTDIATVVASDIDADSLTYAIVGGTGEPVFTIDPTTGAITVTQPLDFETTSSYTLDVEVTDDGSPALTATETITISVVDTNDAPIVVTGQTVSVGENTPAGTVTLDPPIVATDIENDTLTYSLVDPGGYVTIDPATGEIIRTAKPLNHEATPQLTVTVTATDPSGGQGSAPVTVFVTDRNDSPTIAPFGPFDIDENQANATLVGQINASDEDGDALTYSLTGPGSSNFAIDALGKIRNTSPLDFETASSYSLTLTVTDSAVPGATATAPVVIVVNDVNETPVVEPAQTFTISEDAAPPLAVTPAVAKASDGDADALTFSLDDPSNTFAINPTTGEISLASSLDFEAATSYPITIIATDPDGATGSEPATIDIIDVNEAPTIVAPPVVPVRVLENSPAGTVVTDQITATDPEGNQLTFAMNDPSGIFAIDPTTGEISVFDNTDLDTENQTLHTVVITVDDSLSGGTGSDTLTLDIDVTDQNEAPEITPTIIPVMLENTTPSAVVASLVATDPENDTLSWSIVGGTGDGIFSIDPLTGEITLDVAVDYDTAPPTTQHTLDIIVDDGLLTDTQTIVIPIGNFDEPPVINPNQTFTIDENVPTSTPVTGGAVTFVDPDGDPVTWSIVDPTNTFGIDANGNIFRAGPATIDVESFDTYTVQVTATGSPAAQPSTESVIITVGDVNEPPELTISGRGNVDENLTPSVQVVSTISTFEPDGDSFQYEITGGTGLGLFSIDPTTGVISTSAEFDFEATNSYTLDLRVFETGTADNFDDTGTITIDINDANDPPVVAAGQIFAIADDQPAGTILNGNAGVVIATDVDSSIVNYAIVGGDPLGNFTIDSSGALSLATAINFDDGPVRTLLIEATDDGTPAETSAPQSVTVTVESRFGATPSPFMGQVIFNEVSFSGHKPGSTQTDFIEIYNISGGTVSLEGWTIFDYPAAEPDANPLGIGFGPGQSLVDGGRAVIWLDPNTTETAPDADLELVVPPTSTTTNETLRPNDDLFMYDDNGLLVAYLAWGDEAAADSEIGLRPPFVQWGVWDPTFEADLILSGNDSLSLTADGINHTMSGCWERTGSGDALANGNCATAIGSVDTDPDPTRTNSAGDSNDPIHAPGLALANPVISEFAVNGMVDSGTGNANFIELYNASPYTYDRKDIRLEIYQNGTLVGNSPISIGGAEADPWTAGEHYLIGQLFGPFGIPGNNTDAIFLPAINSWDYSFQIVHNQYGVLDLVGSSSSGLSEGTGVSRSVVTNRPQSFKRKSVYGQGTCQDTNDNATDFTKHNYDITATRIVDGIIPCTPPTYQSDPAARLVIGEITTGLGVDEDEFIELFNPSTTPISLRGYRIYEDGGLVANLPNFTLQPGDTYLLGGQSYSGPLANRSFTKNISQDNVVDLRDPAGTVIDQITFAVDLPATRNRLTSWERGNNGCQNSGNASFDFEWRSIATPRASNPATATPCS